MRAVVLPRGETSDMASLIKASSDAVDPSETECLFDSIVVVYPFLSRGFHGECEPDLFGISEIGFEPLAPFFAVCGVEDLLFSRFECGHTGITYLHGTV